MEKNLREQIAHDLWYRNTKSRYQWEYLTSDRKKAWYKKADFLINIFKEYVKGCELNKDEIMGEVWEFGNVYVCEHGEVPKAGDFYEHISHATISKVMEGLE